MIYWIRVNSDAPYKEHFRNILPEMPKVKDAVVYYEWELPIYFMVQFENSPILDANGNFVQNKFKLVPAHKLDDIHPCVKGGYK